MNSNFEGQSRGDVTEFLSTIFVVQFLRAGVDGEYAPVSTENTCSRIGSPSSSSMGARAHPRS